ncbi:MAG: hypothetical protein JWO57_3820 [Pseudonocardiales bacterium]|nr:hypothetical protein [Pseudonocardiales bacterium]
MDREVGRRTLIGGGLVLAGAAGASAVWAAESNNDSDSPAGTGGVVASVAQHALRTWDVAQMGDSITFAGSVGGVAGSVDSGMCVFGDTSYLGTALPLTRGRFRFAGTWATPGFSSAQIMTIHLPSVLAARPAVCVVLAGTNDIGKIALSQTQQNIQQMVTALQKAGTLPILATIPPYNVLTGPRLRQLTAFNVWITRFARQAGLPLVDFHAALIDPATGHYRAGFGNPADGVHPTAAGAGAMGRALADVLNAIPGTAPAPLLSGYTPEGALLTDVCQTGKGTWDVAGAPGGNTYRRETGAGWLGNKGMLTAKTTPASYVIGTLASQPAAGHRMQLAFVLDAPSVPAGGSWSCVLADSVSFKAICGYALCTQELTNTDGNAVSVWEFDMPVMPQGSKTVFTYYVQGAPGVTLGCAQVSLVDLTALGAV